MVVGMKSIITKKDKGVLIKLPQRFVLAEAEELREYCLSLLGNDGETQFDINFADCEFIDSSGLGALVSVYKQCLGHGVPIVLSSMDNGQVREIFRLTKLDRIFPVVQEAGCR